MDSVALQRRYVIGMGASAGGLEALTQLVAELPTESGSIFVVAQHLSASHRSMMSELLAHQTTLAVREIVADEIPLPNIVYTVPAGTNLVFREGRFHLETPPPEVVPKPSINLLFESMAQEFGAGAVGIVLSGTGSDGTAGLQAIKAAGGMTFVQTPESAKYDGMPRSAIEAGVADYVAPPVEISHVLDHLLRLPAESTFPAGKPEEHRVTFADLLEKVRQHTQIDFSSYKPATVQRRLQRRMNTTKTFTLEAYLAYVDTHPDELDALAHEALISVTEFFRNPEAFRALQPHLLDIVEQKVPDDELRVWVVGCASGEEAYSMAILCMEVIAAVGKPLRLNVFATDIDNDALALARRGYYGKSALAELPGPYLERYFQPHNKGYEVSKALRDCVAFARQDITTDPAFPKLDLVSCRNVLIYFNNDLQAKVLANIHRCLLEHGLLFLGHSETIHQQETLFLTIDNYAKIFRSRGAVAVPTTSKIIRGQLKRSADSLRNYASSQESAFLGALSERVGTLLLIDGSFKILHTHGDVGHFISFPSGTPELHLARLIVPEFSAEVSTTLYRAQRRKVTAFSRSCAISSLDDAVWRLVIHPLGLRADQELFLVVFEPADHPSPPISEEDAEVGDAAMQAEQSMAYELALARERLQTMAEDLSAYKEEMSALTEELQTSNEELQASNEELISANDESQHKSAELAAINSDFESLFNTLEFPVLLLDNQLQLKRANGAAMRHYALSMSSTGQHFAQLDLPYHLRQLETQIGNVVFHAARESITVDGEDRVYQVFITPVVTGYPPIAQGVVLAVVDETELVTAQQKTTESEERLRSIMHHSMSLVSVKDATGCYEFINHRFETIFGLHAEDVLGKTDQQIFGLELGQKLRAGDLDVMLKLAAIETTEEIALPTATLWLNSIRFPIFDAGGNLRSVCTQSQDITYRHDADLQLRLASSVFERAGEAIVITDAKARILRVNEAFTKITGYAAEEVVGQNPRVLKSGRHLPQFYESMWHSLTEQGSWQGEIVNRRRSGDVYPEWLTINAVKNDQEQIVHFVAIFSDISALKSSQQRIEFLATHDELTGLPNRSLLNDRLRQALFLAQRQTHKLAVLFIDLDNFKTINDGLGHDVGDGLLKQVAQRLRQCIREADTLARLGGDEFVALLPAVHLEEVNQIAARIIDNMATAFTVDANVLHVSASIGISVYPEDGDDTVSLLRNADTAMYRAKDRGRNQYQFFVEEMKVLALQRMAMETGLRSALEHDRLYMVYQPKVDLRTGQAIAAEALLRWKDPILGDVPPSQFIPIAENCGLIDAVGNRVLDMVLRQIARWREQGLQVPRISINVSAHQLRDPDFVQHLIARLEYLHVPASNIGIELTESVLMQRIDVVRERLIQLAALGTTLSVDDFGTGYSSLAYLRKLPLHELKVDRSFVDGIAVERDDRSIAKTIIDMAHALGLQVVAEGVETQEQLQVLEQDGCDVVQGYLYHRPMGAAEFEKLLAAPSVSFDTEA
ncbi:EAL domain-containing protein [Candidatus Symbiobacter mobilis]|uniref:protein-glutamate O-methyltransferase n=1 Tax=Candidatus Symbiobacter mobilis CR TaxID=946483 RepID=U5NBJ4_9BURK|nr:EAL domain-containing protein [Candidatus Symbiobacter mobilis]AGX88690.1 signal transduction protein [Candidatus Symbiobacter mobilis CR]